MGLRAARGTGVIGMDYRTLGSTGLEVSAIGFGGNRLGVGGGRDEQREAEATLRAAIERGVTLFDTANSYGGGRSEALLGRVLKQHRDRLLLCSKVGQKHWSSVLHERLTDPMRLSAPSLRRSEHSTAGSGARPRPPANFAPRMIELAVAGSLRRLKTDRVDVLYLHAPPPEVLADPAVFAALDRLVERGWVRSYGVSFPRAASTAQIVDAISRWPRIQVAQLLINVRSSLDLARIAAARRDRPVAIVAQLALEKGKLLADTEVVRAAAASPARTVAQTLLRFPLQCEGVAAVLAGMRTRAHLDENIGALATPPLSDEELARLRSLTTIR